MVTLNRPLCPCATKESKIGWYISPLITTATTTITITNNITRTETPWITNNNNNKRILKNGVWERERRLRSIIGFVIVAVRVSGDDDDEYDDDDDDEEAAEKT